MPANGRWDLIRRLKVNWPEPWHGIPVTPNSITISYKYLLPDRERIVPPPHQGPQTVSTAFENKCCMFKNYLENISTFIHYAVRLASEAQSLQSEFSNQCYTLPDLSNSNIFFLLNVIQLVLNLQAPCVLYIGQAFHYSPENAFYKVYLINKYISLSDVCLSAHH